ncbi:Sigma-54-dependent Fis family transcriptional regulator [Sulfidibacter corallicola]|uniref:Sigma-54-dependent Fis family transcriptional regulator n=1 Tax=Sulfidibacter corallicola TaxID=2818388 RepID=A0A8A4U3G2_SULCO|nr:sigma-54 dependent transcriptional regulator [Sulfidibacter corallicola]QTD53285.1 sigma-54-dependent Fis family transcriptional regulator [Sulfidibacter corallicola]
MKPNKGKILVVDDDAAIRRSLDKILKYEGYETVLAENGSQGVNLALQEEPDLILLDIKMPRMDGIEVLQTLIKQGTTSPVVMISGHGTISTAVEATQLGAFDFLEKPLDRERILIVARNALEKKTLQEANKVLQKREVGRYRMVGEHPQMGKLKDRIDRVAATNATVLVTGESGTGKELIARRIHESSGRKGPFVQVNCAAIPEELIESELFGHVKGAFTGATDNQLGKFQLADGGTIFLDEVADMSLNTQAKVLRVLQEGEVQAVGSNKVLTVDVRVVAATNKDLEKQIEENNFREDLFFRLNVVPVRSLSLNERRDDIPLLVDHFKKQFESDNGLKPRGMSKEAQAFFQTHHYRGNIRELKNLVERLLILGEEEVLQTPSSGVAKPTDRISFEGFTTLKKFKEEMEREFLIAKLRQNNGNISKTAEAIDTPRSNLYKKLELYKLNVEELLS